VFAGMLNFSLEYKSLYHQRIVFISFKPFWVQIMFAWNCFVSPFLGSNFVPVFFPHLLINKSLRMIFKLIYSLHPHIGCLTLSTFKKLMHLYVYIPISPLTCSSYQSRHIKSCVTFCHFGKNCIHIFSSLNIHASLNHDTQIETVGISKLCPLVFAFSI